MSSTSPPPSPPASLPASSSTEARRKAKEEATRSAQKAAIVKSAIEAAKRRSNKAKQTSSSTSAFPVGLQQTHHHHLPAFLSNLFRRKKRHIFVEQKKFRRQHRIGNKFAIFAAFCLLLSFATTTLLVSANSRQAWYRALWQEQQELGALQTFSVLRAQYPEAMVLSIEQPWSYRAFYIPSFAPETRLLLTDSKTKQALLLDSMMPQQAMYQVWQKTWRTHLVLTAILALTTLAALVLWFRQVFVTPLSDTVHAIHRFTDDPGNLMTMLIASDRADEIGFLQRELTRMQVVYRISIKQYQHLAALGGAVTKINHDLKGLLSTALIAGESLRKTTSSQTKRETSSKTRLFESALERAIALCEQLLVYVREDKKPIFVTRVQLENLLHSLSADLRLHAKGTTKVTTSLAPTLPVQGDADELYRALRNLGQNAIEAKAQNLRITLTGNKQNAHIDFADDGPGLPRKAKQSLFKPFTHSSKVGGSGLGLSIAQELIEQHNGSLTLAQSSSAGTTFHCVFPVALGTAPKRQEQKTAQKTEPKTKPKRSPSTLPSSA